METNQQNRWVASTNDEAFYFGIEEATETKEEAIRVLEHNVGGFDENQGIYVGTIKNFHLSPLSAEDFLERSYEQHEEELGDWSESWLDKVNSSKEVKALIESKLTELCNSIMEIVPPTFYTVENMERVVVNETKTI